MSARQVNVENQSPSCLGNQVKPHDSLGHTLNCPDIQKAMPRCRGTQWTEQGSKGVIHTLCTRSHQGENETLDIKFNVCHQEKINELLKHAVKIQKVKAKESVWLKIISSKCMWKRGGKWLKPSNKHKSKGRSRKPTSHPLLALSPSPLQTPNQSLFWVVLLTYFWTSME